MKATSPDEKAIKLARSEGYDWGLMGTYDRNKFRLRAGQPNHAAR